MLNETLLLLLQLLFTISMWLSLSFISHTLFLAFTTTLSDIYYYCGFLLEGEMKCQKVKSLALGVELGFKHSSLSQPPLQPLLPVGALG